MVALTDQTGVTAARYTYDPWGKPLTITNADGTDVSADPIHIASLNPFRYAGYRYDTESGLYYLQARYYSPAIYRFLTRDPDGGDKDNPTSQNAYVYGNDNPVVNVDPDGQVAAAVPLVYGLYLAGACVVGLAAWQIERTTGAVSGLVSGAGSAASAAGTASRLGQRAVGVGVGVAAGMLRNRVLGAKSKPAPGTSLRGGKKSQRDPDFGIKDKEFWRWWHRVGKKGGADLTNKNRAWEEYRNWLANGRPRN